MLTPCPPPLALEWGSVGGAVVSAVCSVSICTFVPVKQVNREHSRAEQRWGRLRVCVQRHYMYFGTSKASKLSTRERSSVGGAVVSVRELLLLSQHAQPHVHMPMLSGEACFPTALLRLYCGFTRCHTCAFQCSQMLGKRGGAGRAPTPCGTAPDAAPLA